MLRPAIARPTSPQIFPNTYTRGNPPGCLLTPHNVILKEAVRPTEESPNPTIQNPCPSTQIHSYTNHLDATVHIAIGVVA